MSRWPAVEPAELDLADPTLPRSPRHGDVYHARAGALAQARAVFLAGNRLPERWRAAAGAPPADEFTVLETGFGLGQNFLAAWAAWREAAQAPHGLAARRLTYLGIDMHPPRRDDLARALAHHAQDADLAAQVHALVAAWPLPTPDLHLIDLDADGPAPVRLLLAWAPLHLALPELRVKAQAFFLDGFAPAANPEMWTPRVLRALGRCAAPGATLATWCVAGEVRRGLETAGFVCARRPGFGGKRQMLVGEYRAWAERSPSATGEAAAEGAPPASPATPNVAPLTRAEGPVRSAGQAGPLPVRPRRVAVVGAGLAGASAAAALARGGCEVMVLEAQAAPAQGGSNQPAGLFHAVVHADDGPHARWLRIAALQMQARMRASGTAAPAAGWPIGLYRGESALTPEAMLRLIQAQGLPSDLVQPCPWPVPAAASTTPPEAEPTPAPAPAFTEPAASEPAASEPAPQAASAQVQPMPESAWFYPGGGVAVGASLVAAWLATPGVSLRTGVRVARLQPAAQGWRLLDAQGDAVTQADDVVLACAADAARLIRTVPAAADPDQAWPCSRTRGQTTRIPPAALAALPPGLADAVPEAPLAAGHYVLRLPDGGVLCGATRQANDDGRLPRLEDHRDNLAGLVRLLGQPSAPWLEAIEWPEGPMRLEGRVGFRLRSPDRLPLLGAVPARQVLAEPAAGAAKPPGGRDWPRVPGLWLWTALGSRGLTQAALGGDVLAALILGATVPLPNRLRQALDPARFLIRSHRRHAGADLPAQD